MKCVAVILAAGRGKRMKSDKPKVLHEVCGKPMLFHVLDTLSKVGIDNEILVLGHESEQITTVLNNSYSKDTESNLQIVYQQDQLGTGHAVMQAEQLLKEYFGPIIVICGDTPLIKGDTLYDLIKFHQDNQNAATVLTTGVADPKGYGRIIRDDKGLITKIVEDKDASLKEKAIDEVNSGIYCFSGEKLFVELKKIQPQNSQGEYYLTDVIAIMLNDGEKVQAMFVSDSQQFLGINDRRQLAEAAAVLNKRKLDKLMDNGVTIIDPSSVWIDEEVEIGRDTIIHPFTVISGSTSIGKQCVIEPYSKINNCCIEDKSRVDGLIRKDQNIN